jgi:hypothetical protein
MAEYVVPIRGGLGDAILKYMLPGDCGRIEALRRIDPDAIVRCDLVSTNEHSAEFLAPIFDSVDYRPWSDEVTRRPGNAISETIEWIRPEIWLDDDERALANSIGQCVVLHPFAGTQNREWASRVRLDALIDSLIDLGKVVVLLGGTSTRDQRKITESFAMERPGLVNMINRQSVRLQAHMAATAAAFVGSFSCYHCAAFATERPALVLASSEFKMFFSNRHPVYGTMIERDCTQIHFFEDNGMHDRIVDFIKEIA